MELCPHCRKWEIGAGDSHCSWCGAKLVDFEVSLDRPYLYANEVLERPLKLTITHTGTVGNIRIDEVRSDQSWLYPHTDKLTGRTLWKGGSLSVEVEVDTMQPSPEFREATLTVVTGAGERPAKLELVPPPEFQVFTGEYTVLLDELSEEKASGHLIVTRGLVAIEGLSTDVEWAGVRVTNQSQAPPYRLDQRANSRLDFEFNFDEARLKQLSGGRFPAEHAGYLRVKLAGFDEPSERPFHINCQLAPALIIQEETGQMIERDVFLGKRAELQLTLLNGEAGDAGHVELQILDIKPDVGWLQPLGSISYPLTIQSGQFKQVGFAATTNEIGEGSHIAHVAFLTNTPGAERQKESLVRFHVKQLPDFAGVLAIDFGTVNSCGATADLRDAQGQPTRIRLEDDTVNHSPTTAPSAILYYDKLDGNVRDYDIGTVAYDYSYQPLAAASTVRQAKRLLGRTEALAISYFREPSKQDSLLPREVAADIIKRILDRAEDQLKARVTHCTFSHPSRFSMRQIADLKAAVVSCGIREENLSTIHEPLGAALSYIQESAKPGEDADYHLMVYDFGGGTTDISLIHVESVWKADQEVNIVAPRVLGTTGDRWFGGEDITDDVMQISRAKFIAAVQAASPEANVVLPFDAEDFNDPRRQLFAKQNRVAIRRWAEQSKIAISEYGDEHAYKTTLTAPNLTVIVNDEVRLNESFEHEQVVPKRAEVDERIRPRLEALAEEMENLAREHKAESPDVILLSGKSSALPVVREVIERRFPRSAIVMPNDLKECVVMGACRRFHTDVVAGVYINLEHEGGLSATTSRLGIRVSEAGQIKFKGLIAAGVPIEAHGLRVPVKGIVLQRSTRIRILENTGPVDDWIVNGKENKNINELKVFRLEHKLAEWERGRGFQITNQSLIDAGIELEVTQNLGVKLIATIPGIEEQIEFEAELTGY